MTAYQRGDRVANADGKRGIVVGTEVAVKVQFMDGTEWVPMSELTPAPPLVLGESHGYELADPKHPDYRRNAGV